MITYDFTKRSGKEFCKLPGNIQRKIIKKVEFYLTAPDPLSFAKRLTGTDKAFRFAVDDYRVIFDWESDNILILRVGHRREVYRGI